MIDLPPTAPFSEAPRWFVCHTKPRCEKKFDALLKTEGFDHYLPLFTLKRKYGGRMRESKKPVMPGYVFANLPGDISPRLYQQALLVRSIYVKDQERLLREMEDIRRLVASGLPASLVPTFEKGTRVRIKHGPLMGIIALVEKPDSHKGVMIAIDVLRQGLLVPIKPEDLEILD